MLGVLRRHWKPKRDNSGRKKKEKGGTDGDHDLSLSPKESSRACRSVRDTHQVHPEKEADRVGVLGKDCTILVTSQKDISLLSHPHILKDFHKESSLSPVLPLKDGNFKDQISATEIGDSRSWEDNLKGESVDDNNSDEKQWRKFHGYVDSNIDDGSARVIPRDNNVNVFKDESPVRIDDRNCSAKESVTTEDEKSESEGEKEKSDPAKESLERQVEELKSLLHQGQHEVQIPREWIPKEGLKLELEREKMLRTEAERRLNEMKLESERCKARLASLHDDCQKMEEVVHSMLRFRSRIEQLKHEKSSITLSYESKIRKYQLCIASLEKENFMLQNELKSLEASNKDRQKERERSLSRILLERLQLLEQENSALVLENEQQRLQYERCLDDVANQVVHALLAQKCLREDCSKLQRRVQDLEYQNCTLTFMFKHRFLKPSEPSIPRFPPAGHAPDDSSRNSFQDSPSHTSHSEDSTESLASLCSDYSIHSGSSSSSHLVSHPGLPKMSSPPQWLRERAVSLQTKSRSRLSSSVIGNAAFIHQQPTLKRSGVDLMAKHAAQEQQKEENITDSDQVHLRKKKSIQRTNRKPCTTLLEGRVWQQLHEGMLSPGRREGDFHHRDRSQKKPTSCKNSKDNLAELGGLDAVETPSDECFNVEGLPLLKSTHRVLVSTQYRPVSEVWGPQPWNARNSTALGRKDPPTIYVSSATQTCDVPEGIYFHGELLESRSNVPVTLTNRPAPGIPRPTTLNVVPHVMSDPAHNFNFPALEQKSHIVNKCGNMYEEVDLPVFPPEREKTGDSNFSTEKHTLAHDSRVSSFMSQQQDSLYNTTEEQISSCEDSETAMNTVIRKPHHSEISVQSDVHKESSSVVHEEFNHHHNRDNIPKQHDSEQLHLTQNVFSAQQIESSLLGHENESPLSVGENREHGGKDEGYSTMSSDVQEVGGVGGFLDPVRQPRSGMLFNHSPSYLTFESSIPEPVAEGDEKGMLSSSDSGLGFQRSLQEMQQSSEELEEEEVCCGFERDLDSSLIRCEKNKNVEKSSTVINSECVEDSKKKDVISQESMVCEITSANDNSATSGSLLGKDQNLELNNANILTNHSKKNMVHPVFDKIYTLLTPRGFRAHRNNPRRVTLPFIQQTDSICSATYPFKQRVQTAEKATSTEPEQDVPNEEGFKDILSDSSISISSTGSLGYVKIPPSSFKGGDKYIFGNHAAEEAGLKLHFRKTLDRVNIAVEVSHYGSVNTEASKDNVLFSTDNVLSQDKYSAELQQENRSKSVPVKSIQENFDIQRTYSDSQLWVKSPQRCGRDLIKSSSLSTRQTTSRLNFLPLEHHMSACNLNSPPVTPSSLTPPLRRSQRQVLINHLAQKQKTRNNSEPNGGISRVNRWQTKQQHSPSISLSSVHSTSSEDVPEEEEEEFGATSLKHPRDPELNSPSEDEYDLMEHHSFVEQWLQKEDGNVSTALQNGYTYDEEEVGNWSFYVSTEDGAPPCANNGNNLENAWSKTGEKSYSCHLEKIQENSLEDEFQDDLWSRSLWNSVITQSVQAQDQSGSHWQQRQEDEDNNKSNCIIPLPTSDTDLHSVPVYSAEEGAVECTVFENTAVDSSETYVSTATWTASLSDHTTLPVAARMSPVGEEVEALLQDWSDLSSRHDSCCDVSVIVSEPLTNTEDSIITMPPSTESDKSSASVLQPEATEFNRDFYMLCAVGSTRSLSASECGSHIEPEHGYSLTGVVTCTEGPHSEKLIKEGREVQENTVIKLSPEQITALKSEQDILKLATTVVECKNWNPASGRNPQVDEIFNPVEVVKTRKVPPKLPSKKCKVKDSAVVSVGFSPGKSPKISGAYYGLSEGKKSPNEKTKLPVRNTSPDKKKNSGKNYAKMRTHVEHESRRSRDDRKRSPGKKHSGAKRTSSSRKVSKGEEHKSTENKNLNQKANNDNEERRSKRIEKNVKSNTEEEKSKKDIGKLVVGKKISPEKSKSPKLNDLEGKSEKEQLVAELELRLSGQSGTVADKIQELNALIANTELEKITVTPEKHKAASQENKESRDSSLERKSCIQKREKALSKEAGIKEGCGTSWVHVEADIDLSDPRARANLLDSMMASSSSSSSGSSEEEEEEEEEGEGEDEVLEHKYHQRLHALHRFRRHRKRASDRDAVISFIPRIRASIIDRHDFYYRYGEKEKEAVACFDFLDDLSTSPSDTGSCEVLTRDSAFALAVLENNNIITSTLDSGREVHNLNTHNSDSRTEATKMNRFSLDESRLSGSKRLPEERLSSTTLNSQDGEPIDHISLSDSCAESYSSSTHSLNHIS